MVSLTHNLCYSVCIIFLSVCLLTEFHPSLAVKEHILWFEVTVDDSLLMTAVHRLTYLI